MTGALTPLMGSVLREPLVERDLPGAEAADRVAARLRVRDGRGLEGMGTAGAAGPGAWETSRVPG